MKKMTSFRLAVLQLWNKRWRVIVQWLMVLSGFAMVSGFYTLESVANDQLVKDIGSINQVWAAKGSPLNGLLANVYHIEAPLGNIPLSELDDWISNPMVKQATRISYGDTYNGRRILGADPSWKTLYNLELSEGVWPQGELEICLSEVLSRELNLNIGDHFKGAHGEVVDEHQHEEEYVVVGVFKPSGTVADRVLLTTLESVWHVHHTEADKREVTAVLVETSSPMAMFQLPRQINSKSTFQAILPSIEVNRIYALLDNTRMAFIVLSVLFLVLGGLSIAITLYETIRAQQFDHTLLRVFGLSPSRLGFTIFLQSALLLTTAWIGGIALVSMVKVALNSTLQSTYGLQITEFQVTLIDLKMLALAIGLAILITIPIILRIFRMTIHKNLQNA